MPVPRSATAATSSRSTPSRATSRLHAACRRGAISDPTGGNLGPDGRFLSPDRLRARLEALADPAAPTVVQCGSGINACHTAFAMRLAGLPDPLLYPGSYSDWSRSGMTVATGPDPGSGS